MAENYFGQIDTRGESDVTYNVTPLSTASAFDTTKVYKKDAFCFYGGLLYKFIADKTAGVWDSTKVEAVTVAKELHDLDGTKSDAIEETVSGSLVTITDGAPLPVKDLTVAIEPVQDLHGYDNPWSEGGSKNKLGYTLASLQANNTLGTWSNNVYTYNGISYTIADDGSVTASGTASAESRLYLARSLEASDYAENYLFGGVNQTGVRLYLQISSSPFNTLASNYGQVNGVQIASNTGECYCYISISTGAGQVSGIKFYPMICDTNTDNTWSPYSNICPITGFTEANVTRTGKNLLNPTSITTGKYISGSVEIGNTITLTNSSASYVIGKVAYVIAGQTYTLSWNQTDTPASTNDRRGCICDGNNVVLENNLRVWGNSKTFLQITPNVSGWLWISADNNSTDFQLELGSIASTYEPYNGTTYTISFGSAGTVYGGTLNGKTGVLTVTHVIADFGDFTWTYYTDGTNPIFYVRLTDYVEEQDKPYIPSRNELLPNLGVICSAYGAGYQVYSRTKLTQSLPDKTMGWIEDSSSITFRNSDYTSASTFKTAMTGQKFVYPLATPLTYQLTPTEVTTLLGENNIFADTGDSTVTYRADTKTYIDQKIAESQRATRSLIAGIETEMTATKNYSTGDLLIIGDKLYKATTNIGNGNAITVGTNVTATTVAEQLIALANA